MANVTYSSCLYCSKFFVIKSNHINKKFCNLSCSTLHKNKIEKENKLRNYLLNPTHCKNCSSIIDYKSRRNKFCCQSCSATYTNRKKDWSKIRTGPLKWAIPKNYFPKTQIQQCIICNRFHPRKGKTCSTQCFSKHMSNITRGKTGGNRDCNLPGIDCAGTEFYFDSNWEIILSKSLTENNIFWTRPKRFILSDGRSYTPDFYLPEYDVYIDPKAKRKNYYRQSLLKVQKFSLETGYKCLVITEKKFLNWWHIQTMLLLNLTWS